MEERLEEFDNLRADLASIYGLKTKTLPGRKIMSADKFNTMKFQTSDLRSEGNSTNKLRRPLTGIEMANVIPEYPTTQKRNSEAFKKSSGGLRKSKKTFEEDHGFDRPKKLKGAKNLIDDDDDDEDELDDIDNMLNVSLPSNFDIDEEEEDKQEEQKKRIEVHFEEK